MKKVVALLIAIVTLAALFAGCTGEKSDQKDPIVKAQEKVVQIGTDFLNYEITADEAVSKLRSVLVPHAFKEGHDRLVGDIDMLVFLIEREDRTYDSIERKIDYIKKSKYTD